MPLDFRVERFRRSEVELQPLVEINTVEHATLQISEKTRWIEVTIRDTTLLQQ